MAHRIVRFIVVFSALALPLTCRCLARESEAPRQNEPANLTGIATDRLSNSQLRVWKSIIDVVMATDRKGSYLHPTLFAIYEEVASGGHLVRIEFAPDESQCRAAEFILERPDPDGFRHVAVIRLNLATIRHAYVPGHARYTNGLIPFAGLRDTERYAEALGHELAHAVSIFQNSELLRVCLQLKKEAAELDMNGLNAESAEQLQRLGRIAQLQRELEKPAEAAELHIWRELRK